MKNKNLLKITSHLRNFVEKPFVERSRDSDKHEAFFRAGVSTSPFTTQRRYIAWFNTILIIMIIILETGSMGIMKYSLTDKNNLYIIGIIGCQRKLFISR